MPIRKSELTGFNLAIEEFSHKTYIFAGFSGKNVGFNNTFTIPILQ